MFLRIRPRKMRCFLFAFRGNMDKKGSHWDADYSRATHARDSRWHRVFPHRGFDVLVSTGRRDDGYCTPEYSTVRYALRGGRFPERPTSKRSSTSGPKLYRVSLTSPRPWVGGGWGDTRPMPFIVLRATSVRLLPARPFAKHSIAAPMALCLKRGPEARGPSFMPPEPLFSAVGVTR